MKTNVPNQLVETDLKQVPITIETAHQFFNKRQMSFIVKLYKETYKQGFVNGLAVNKAIIIFLFTSLSFGQSAIVAAGGNIENISYTIGPGLSELQISVLKETSLGVPTFEKPTQPKPIVKKRPLTFLEKLLLGIKNIFK